MNKKKDFKGVTGQILSNRPKSLDDFLGESDARSQQPAPAETSTFEKHTQIEDLPSDNNAQVKPQEPSPSKHSLAPRPEHNEPEKTRISLFLATRSSYELDALKTEMRRMAPRADLSKISKSSIVESAIDIVANDFRKNGLDSTLARLILK
jgi:hypothetical protein